MAARLLPDVQFVVGSAYRLAVLDASVDVVTSVFAPHPFEEFRRVLQPGGRWVTVTPGPLHLCELRPQLAGDRRRVDEARLERRAGPPLEATTAERVQFTLPLTPAALGDLLSMTPIRWQAGAVAAGVAEVTVDVWVSRSS
jgi:23S rRNA (guanine745-N1)-methyltransferase